MVDAGHILGSASVEMTVTEPGAAPKIVIFSADIGVKHRYTDPAAPGLVASPHYLNVILGGLLAPSGGLVAESRAAAAEKPMNEPKVPV